MPVHSAEAPNEFSRIVTPDRLGGPKTAESLAASTEERGQVARRLGILAVDRLEADLVVKNLGAGQYRVEGPWEAEVQQACVVTLEPVADRLSGRLEAAFEARDGKDQGSEVVVDPEAADPPEALPAAGIDLGELVVQELAVALDPYPRAPGAKVPAAYRPPEVDEDKGPFAALKALKGDK